MAASTDAAPSSTRTFLQILKSFRERKVIVMFALGFASGLPYAALAGTLYAWFTAADVDVSTIGILSWAGLGYGFKFLWSPILNLKPPPLFSRLGVRRGWILFCQLLVALCFLMIVSADPQTSLGIIALASVLGIFAAATQDIAIDAWRIEAADDASPLDLLSTIYQFGFRIAAFAAGAGALFLIDWEAANLSWNNIYFLIALLVGVGIAGTMFAIEPEAHKSASGRTGIQLGAGLTPRTRNAILIPILIGWAWAAYTLFGFMAQAVLSEEGANAIAFTRNTGPWIVAVCVLAPALAGALILYLEGKSAAPGGPGPDTKAQRALNGLYGAILEPMVDLIARLKYAAILILVLVLSYRYTDLVWGAFAYPFYLGQDASIGALGHTMTEVAIASKTFGAVMTILGIAGGGVALLRFGRMPCLVVGAVLAAATNLLFADLALGGARTDAFLAITQLDHLFHLFGADQRMTRLMAVITAENLSVGFASAVFVAYLSSIVNPRYSAVQYALLASLTMLLGALGRGALGELIEERGYAYVFVLTAVLGLVAVAASIGEWARVARDKRRGSTTPTQTGAATASAYAETSDGGGATPPDSLKTTNPSRGGTPPSKL